LIRLSACALGDIKKLAPSAAAAVVVINDRIKPFMARIPLEGLWKQRRSVTAMR
jgi:hypothetical protein